MSNLFIVDGDMVNFLPTFRSAVVVPSAHADHLESSPAWRVGPDARLRKATPVGGAGRRRLSEEWMKTTG